MKNFQDNPAGIPEEQLRIRAKCFHPSGAFEEFKEKDIEQSIPERFEQISNKYYEKLSIKSRDQQLTYGNLNKFANRVAHAILARAEQQRTIALLLEHNAPIFAAMLGVLKTGNAYVPLDSSYPRERLNYMLKDSQATILLTDNNSFHLTKKLAYEGHQLINIDELESYISDENPNLCVPYDNIAFIIYTSGSTGRPKGVIQTHRNVLHEIMNYTNAIHICAEDKVSLLESCSSSGSIRNIYSSLLNGATLYPLDIKNEGISDIADWLIDEGITFYRSVASAFRQFAATLTGNEKFTTVRVIRLGGETLYKNDVELYKKYFSPECIFVCGLGNSETFSFRWYYIDKKTKITDSSVPNGYPLKDMEILLYDNKGKELSFNDVGEIAVRSKYISPGYWNRPDLTDDRFLPDPNDRDKRIYLTGDMGLMKSDGCLVHMGRKDFQVMIRGYRVELAEIETALLDISTVKEAAVMARRNNMGEHYLVAYCVPTTKSPLTVSVIVKELLKKLPDYMVPTRFVMLDALPINPNYKIDRQALPEPDNSRPELENLFVLPITPSEISLAKIWSGVLNVEPIGIYDKFIDLGGNSLMAAQIISRVLNTFQVKLSFQSLLAKPTIAEMAMLITQNQAETVNKEELDIMMSDLEKLSDSEAKEISKLI